MRKYSKALVLFINTFRFKDHHELFIDSVIAILVINVTRQCLKRIFARYLNLILEKLLGISRFKIT